MCRDITTLGIYMYTIGTNVCPVVDRLVDCASNREITLRYRESCYNYSHQPPPHRFAAILSHAQIVTVVWPLYIITMTVPCLEKSRSCSTAGVFFVDENCESSKFSHLLPFPLFWKVRFQNYRYSFITLPFLSRADKSRIQIVETNSEITPWFRNAIINRRYIPFANFCPGEFCPAIVNLHGTPRYCYFLRGNALVDSDRLLAIWSTSWNLSARKTFLFNTAYLNIFATL